MTERSSDVDSAPFGAMDRPESNPDKTAKPSDEKSKGEGGGPMKKDWRKERRGKATGDKSQSEGKKRRRSRSRKPGTESADEQSGKVVEQEGEKPKKAEGRNQVRKKRPSRDANQGSGKQVTGKAGGSREKKKREGYF